jgi:predicted RNase H-like HicB family nuclease
MKVYNLTVVIDKDEDGNFLAICPSLQGCYTEGRTKEEALEMIEDAIKLHIEARLEKGELINEEVFSSQLKIAV